MADAAAEQLRRILLVLPALADDKAHPLAEVAARAGTDERTLLQDLRALVTRGSDEPAGFVESVQLAMDADSVRLDAPGFFRRPMGLSVLELEAIELGLATLRQEAPVEEHVTIDRARSRLGDALTTSTSDTDEQPAHAAHFGDIIRADPEARRIIERCVAGDRVVDLSYYGSRDPSAQERKARPFGLIHARGTWFLIGWCLKRNGLRVFRLDRITEARATDETFEPPAEFNLTDVVKGGRVLSADTDRTVTIRYSSRIARWIAEREDDATENDDGSADVTYFMPNEEWAVRHTLQYGAEAEVVEPEAVRVRVRQILNELRTPRA